MLKRAWEAIKRGFSADSTPVDYMGAYVLDPTQAGVMAAASTVAAEPDFAVGDRVRNVDSFEGTVVAAFKKLSGQSRYVVEDDRGVLHVYSAKNLEYRE